MDYAKNRWKKQNYGSLSNFLNYHKPYNINNIVDLSSQEYKDWILNLDKIMSYENIDGFVYRGVSFDFSKELINYRYVACSKDINIAKLYGDFIIRFIIPKNIKSYTFRNDKEKEILIERNTKFVFKGFVKTLNHGKIVIDADIKKIYKTRNNVGNPYISLSDKLNQLSKMKNSNNENSNFSN